MSSTRDVPDALLATARAQLARGEVDAAWRSCRAAAEAGRATGDAAAVADAAVLVPASAAGAWELTAEQHALCQEALGLLGADDPVRTERVRSQLAMTANPFVRPVPGAPAVAARPAPTAADDPGDPGDPATVLLRLRARHADLVATAHAEQRLALADEVLQVAARASGEVSGQGFAWGHLYRLGSLYQLGRRVELDAEAMALSAVVRRLADPVWTWRLLTVQVSLDILEGHLELAWERLDTSAAAGRDCGLEEAPFIDLVLRSRLAVLTGRELPEVERRVRELLSGAPFFARGWHATLLSAMGRRDEVAALWRALSAHLDAMPRESHEWLVATAANALTCVELGDRESAGRLYESLLPVAHLHVIGSPQTPPYGPVSYYLGRLAALRSDLPAARRHLTDAAAHSDAMHAPLFAADARSALAALGADVAPLSAREHEIAVLASRGRTNREIAGALHLSERTVENHISHVLRKLDLPNRAAIAHWLIDRPGPGSGVARATDAGRSPRGSSRRR